MNFDISWFLTLPGILIIAGAVLLLISLILFIVSSKKGNKKKKEENVNVTEEVPSSPVAPTPEVAVATPTTTDVNSVQNTNNIESTPVQPEIKEEKVEPVQPATVTGTTPIVEQPTPVVESNVIPATDIDKVAETTPTAATTIAEPINTEKTLSQPEPTQVTPVTETQAVPTEAPKENHEIYGGAVPTVEIEKPEENHEIYGGANPLDKTQTIPTINSGTIYGEPVAKQPIEQPTQNVESVQAAPEIPQVDTNSVEQQSTIPSAQPEATIVDQKEDDKDVEVLL